MAVSSEEFTTDVVKAMFENFRARQKGGEVSNLGKFVSTCGILLKDCLLDWEQELQSDNNINLRCIEALLLWSISKLRPPGHPPKLKKGKPQPEWRKYYTWRYFYIELMDKPQIATEIALASLDPIYDYLEKGLCNVTRTLNNEMELQQDAPLRRQMLILCRYKALSKDAQKMFHYLVAFQKTFPLDHLQQLVDDKEVDANALLQQLHDERLVKIDQQDVMVVTELREYLYSIEEIRKSLVKDRAQMHNAIAKYLVQQCLYRSATEHWLRANMDKEAAEIVTEHYEGLVRTMSLEKIYDLLEKFRQQNILVQKGAALHLSPQRWDLTFREDYISSVQVWLELKLVAGKIVQQVIDDGKQASQIALAKAVAEYEEMVAFLEADSISLSDLLQERYSYYKLRALHGLARTHQLRGNDLTNIYFSNAVSIFESTYESSKTSHSRISAELYEVSIEIHIDFTWHLIKADRDTPHTYIEAKRYLHKTELLLEKAQKPPIEIKEEIQHPAN